MRLRHSQRHALRIGRIDPAEVLELAVDDVPRHPLHRGRDVAEQPLLLIMPQNAEQRRNRLARQPGSHRIA